MSIEFRCPQCQKLLRVGDDAVGKQARCPACGTQATVPSAAPPSPTLGAPQENPFAPSSANAFANPPLPPMPSPPPVSDNPYAAPMYTGANTMSLRVQPTTISINRVFDDAWNVFKSNMGMLILVHFVELAIIMAANFATAIPMVIVAGNDEDLFLVLSLLRAPLFALAAIWLACGRDLYFLKCTQGQIASFSLLFSGHTVLLRRFVFLILMGLLNILMILPAVLIGQLAGEISGDEDVGMGVGVLVGALTLIPYVWIGLTYGQAWYVYLDQPVGVFEGFRISGELTQGNKMSLFGLAILTYLLAMIGFCACYVGALFTLPLMYMVFLIAYLQMAGRPIMGPYTVPPRERAIPVPPIVQ